MKVQTDSPAGDLVSYDRWLRGIGKTPPTGWRWRRRGWIETVNIAGRLYISRAAIVEFERRAAAGEFSKIHVTPNRSHPGLGKESEASR